MLKGKILEVEVVGEYRENPFAYDIHIETPDKLPVVLEIVYDWNNFANHFFNDHYYSFLVECHVVRYPSRFKLDQTPLVGTVINLEWKRPEARDPNVIYYWVKSEYGIMLIPKEDFLHLGLENLSVGQVVSWNYWRFEIVGFVELTEAEFYAED